MVFELVIRYRIWVSQFFLKKNPQQNWDKGKEQKDMNKSTFPIPDKQYWPGSDQQQGY